MVSFTFEGREYHGFDGDTLASALAANGQLLLSRSFKYHRPRGAFTCNGLDANGYVQVGDQPSVLADVLPISEGLNASGQNTLGSLRHDLAVHSGRLSRFLPVGFYYRAFFRPQGIWPFWERLFRRAAGLGKINVDADEAYFDKQYLFADVAVIGAGPAGLSAALAAAEQDTSVLLIDRILRCCLSTRRLCWVDR
jgi:sarcosine oxidase subunit alpha